MPLYIKDDEVNDLANEWQRMTGAATKTEAVRAALKDAIERRRDKTSMVEGIRQAQAMARAMGIRPNPDFDFKAFSDELSGGI
jgi:antitoxin VapB